MANEGAGNSISIRPSSASAWAPGAAIWRARRARATEAVSGFLALPVHSRAAEEYNSSNLPLDLPHIICQNLSICVRTWSGDRLPMSATLASEEGSVTITFVTSLLPQKLG